MDTEHLVLPPQDPKEEPTPEQASQEVPLSNLKRMYEIQQRLDRFAGLPFDDPYVFQRLSSATLSEVGEALDAMKTDWAWWPRGQKDHEAFQEEVIDLWFFVLATIDTLQTVGETHRPEHNHEAYSLVLAPMLEIRDHFKDSYDALVKQGADDALVPQVLLQQISYYTAQQPSPQGLVHILGALTTLTWTAGITPDDVLDPGLEERYLNKAVVNLSRWIDAGSIPEELEEEARELHDELYDEIQAREQ